MPKSTFYIFLLSLGLLCLEVFLRCSAKGADPISGQLVKLGSGFNSVIRIADLGIVFVSAKLASVNSIHKQPPCKYLRIFLAYIIMQSARLVK